MTRTSIPVLFRPLLLLALLFGLLGCNTLTGAVAPRDQAAIAEATAIRGDAATLMAKAGEPFTAHAAEVAALRARISSAQIAAAAVPGNDGVAAAWGELMDPDALLGAFLSQWEARGQLEAAVRTELSAVVLDALDLIVKIETDKPE